MHKAFEEASVETMHEWRKRTKILWYHAQFLTAVNLANLNAEIEKLQQLSRKLGQHHDLVLVDALCSREPQAFGTIRYVKAFRAFIRRRLDELQKDVQRAGSDVFAGRARAWIAAQRPRVGPKKSPVRAPRHPANSATA